MMLLLRNNEGTSIAQRVVKAEVETALKHAMDASALTAGVNTYTLKLRRESLGTRLNMLKGITSDPDNDKGDYLFGENVTKRISELYILYIRRYILQILRILHIQKTYRAPQNSRRKRIKGSMVQTKITNIQRITRRNKTRNRKGKHNR